MGGKRQYLPRIRDRLGQFPRPARYVEPFVGGASVFLGIRDLFPTARRVLADANAHLITTYTEVQRNPEGVLTAVEALRGVEANMLRAKFNEAKLPPVQVAAAMLLLNRYSFNGLYRVNRAGAFNAPVANEPRGLPTPEHVRTFSAALAGVTLRCLDFRAVLDEVGAGDLVFLDPPYGGVGGEAGFTGYTAGGFNQQAQLDLVTGIEGLQRRGAHVVLTNGDFPGNREAYEGVGLAVELLQERRSINRDGDGRGAVPCLLAWG